MTRRDRVETGTFEAAGLRRPYRLAFPDGDRTPDGLVVILHGCTQDAADVAAGTGWDAAAGEKGWAVLYPEQVASAHPQVCWRWWSERQRRRDGGEAALIAEIAEQVAERRLREGAGIWLAGLSAGAAMALNVLTLRPDTFRGIGLHSGVPYGAARTREEALAVMAGGGPGSGVLARRLHEAVTADAPPSPGQLPPVLVIHGTADEAVAFGNASRIVEVWHRAAARLSEEGAPTGDGRGAESTDADLFFGGEPEPGRGDPEAPPPPDLPAPDRDEQGEEGLPYRRLRWSAAPGRGPMELWRVEGLGHAWSGGRSEGSYADPKGPSATAAMLRFFRRAGARGGTAG